MAGRQDSPRPQHLASLKGAEQGQSLCLHLSLYIRISDKLLKRSHSLRCVQGRHILGKHIPHKVEGVQYLLSLQSAYVHRVFLLLYRICAFSSVRSSSSRSRVSALTTA